MSRSKIPSLIVVLFFVACVLSSCNRSEQRKELIVSAAISLKDAMEEVRVLYQKNHSVSITLNFGSSGSLRQQISAGAPVDLFFSAADKQMNDLEKEGLLLEGTRKPLLLNKLVLVANHTENAVQTIQDLTSERVTKIAIGEPKSVPVGTYTIEALRSLGLEEKIMEKVVFAKDARQVLAYVESGNVSAGFVYATDIKGAEVTLVTTLPDSLHSPICYPVALLKRTQSPEEATSFLTFLASDTALAVFQKYGFLPYSR